MPLDRDEKSFVTSTFVFLGGRPGNDSATLARAYGILVNGQILGDNAEELAEILYTTPERAANFWQECKKACEQYVKSHFNDLRDSDMPEAYLESMALIVGDMDIVCAILERTEEDLRNVCRQLKIERLNIFIESLRSLETYPTTCNGMIVQIMAQANPPIDWPELAVTKDEYEQIIADAYARNLPKIVGRDLRCLSNKASLGNAIVSSACIIDAAQTIGKARITQDNLTDELRELLSQLVEFVNRYCGKAMNSETQTALAAVESLVS